MEALSGDQSHVEAMRTAFEERRNRITALLSDIEGVSCARPKGAFYVFPDFSNYGLSSTTLAELILMKTGVTTVPGVSFGEKYDHMLRFSYATALETIEKGIAELAKFLATIG